MPELRCFAAAVAAALALSACAAAPRMAPVAPTTTPLSMPTADALPVESPDWWYRSGAEAARGREAGARPARNVILFIGDGMGVATVSAARIFAGQQLGGSGEEHALAFEQFGHTAMVKTYNTDQQTPDSAGTMTAMMSGVKSRAGVIGVDSDAPRADCAAARGTEVPSLVSLAQQAGMRTGIVSTARITHATPAATFAHTPERGWEFDGAIPLPMRAEGCTDIASQLIDGEVGRSLDVVMGGGRIMFLPGGTPDPEYHFQGGRRQDGRNLIEEWQAANPDGHWVWNRAQFDALDSSPAGPVLALFDPDHMKFEHDRTRDRAGEPSLAEMTRIAINRLDSGPQGFVLMVEAGRIDHAHHFNNAFRALSDTVALSDAVQTAADLTDEDDTLILVTADHSHVMSFGGYPRRGNPILGLVRGSFADGSPRASTDATGRAYTTLSYANGPGYAGASDMQPEGPKRLYHEWVEINQAREGRPNLRQVAVEDPDYLQEAMVPLSSETHGGEDVTLYARGPGAQAVRGVIEQHVLFHIMAQALPPVRELLCERGGCEGGTPALLMRPDAGSDAR